jgi:diadenosine tetraphosphate (Ap4A) HIT family hydrolase
MEPGCLTCLSNSGEKRISPGPAIHEGSYWVVEHGYPTALKGWLVIALRRHAEALHELRPPEFEELGRLLGEAVRVLHEEFRCEKEYVTLLSELNGYRHVHFHIIARPLSLPESMNGKQLLITFRTPPEESVPAEDVRSLCDTLRAAFDPPSVSAVRRVAAACSSA